MIGGDKSKSNSHTHPSSDSHWTTTASNPLPRLPDATRSDKCPPEGWAYDLDVNRMWPSSNSRTSPLARRAEQSTSTSALADGISGRATSRTKSTKGDGTQTGWRTEPHRSKYLGPSASIHDAKDGSESPGSDRHDGRRVRTPTGDHRNSMEWDEQLKSRFGSNRFTDNYPASAPDSESGQSRQCGGKQTSSQTSTAGRRSSNGGGWPSSP